MTTMPERPMTIGEFARRTGLAPSVLRYYDRVGLLRPALVGASNRYRLYTVDQIEVARLVGALRAIDMPLERIAEFLRSDNHSRMAILDAYERQVRGVVDSVVATIDSLRTEVDNRGRVMRRVLVVNQAASDRTALQEALSAAQWSLADSAADADLAILETDYADPTEAQRIIRDLTGRTPGVLVVSSSGVRADVESARDAGAVALLLSPFDQDELAHALDVAVHRVAG